MLTKYTRGKSGERCLFQLTESTGSVTVTCLWDQGEMEQHGREVLCWKSLHGWSPGKGNADTQVVFFLCVCVCICAYVCLYVCFYSCVVCTYVHRSMPHVFISLCHIFESLSLDPVLCHWLELLAVKSGASCCCCHHSSTDDTILPSFYLIAEHLNTGPHACLVGTLPALLSFSLALPGPGLEWVFPSQKILPRSTLTDSYVIFSLVRQTVKIIQKTAKEKDYFTWT